jgi:uncharacterized protein (TIGR02145 family)
MKKLLFLIALSYGLKANAQNYLVTFAATGASSVVSTVKVGNMTSGLTLTLNGNEILNLTLVTGVNSFKDSKLSEMKIYPNPVIENAMVEIFPPFAENAVINIFDMIGKPVAQFQSFLENSRQDFRLSGLKTGFYTISVRGKNYQFSGRILSYAISGGTIRFEKVNNVIPPVYEKPAETESKGSQSIVYMPYSAGDRLKFTGISGDFSTVKTDIPTSDKTITFNFIACTDADNNNYPIVQIGSQVWMAENLKTTRFNDGNKIDLVTANILWNNLTSPAYCWYDNNEAAYKSDYGAIYNGYAAYSNKLCPSGWHVPGYTEWEVLINYLGGETVAGGKLKETGTTHWLSPNIGATNESGFTGRPGGFRHTWQDGTSFRAVNTEGNWWNSTPAGGIYNSNTWIHLRNSFTGLFIYAGTNSGFSGHSVRCIKGEIELPEVSTYAINQITQNTATVVVNVTSDGGSFVTTRGICLSTSPNPTVDDNNISAGTGTGAFRSSLTGLTSNTTYYVRAYATNFSGTVYSNQLIFKTFTGTVTDVDGNTYFTVTIGTQLWMAENLTTTKYNNNTSIPQVTNNNSWAGLTTPGYCWYNNDPTEYKPLYGALYNWYALDDATNGGRNVCPTGWVVPTDTEWTTLTDYLINNGYGYEGASTDIAKSMASTWSWNMSTMPGTPGNSEEYNNSSCFSAPPGGYRNINGSFDNYCVKGYWWTTSDSWYRNMSFDYSKVYRGQWGKTHGFSVRCIHGPL